MSDWPTTRVTLLDRLRDTQDHQAWAEFVALYGPPSFTFAQRRLGQDDDAADVVQEVLAAIMRGSYQRSRGRFQKWLVTVLLNKIRDVHAAQVRRAELSSDVEAIDRLEQMPARSEEEEWNHERQRHLFRVAAEHVQSCTNATHWQVFVRTALHSEPVPVVARSLNLSLTNAYAIKSRIMKEIKDEIHRLQEECADAGENAGD